MLSNFENASCMQLKGQDINDAQVATDQDVTNNELDNENFVAGLKPVKTPSDRNRLPVRFSPRPNRKMYYMVAEEEMILAMDELGFEPKTLIPLLISDTSEHLLLAKLQRLKASDRAKAPSGSPRETFREQVREIVRENGGVEALGRDEVPVQKLIDDIRWLVRAHPPLGTKCFYGTCTSTTGNL